MSGSTGAGEPPVTRVEVPGGQGVQVGEGTQDNTFIQNYIAQQVIQPPEVPTAGPVCHSRLLRSSRAVTYWPCCARPAPVCRWCGR